MPITDSIVQIYVVTHKDLFLPITKVLTPIRSDKNTGDNIAEEEAYCGHSIGYGKTNGCWIM